MKDVKVTIVTKDNMVTVEHENAVEVATAIAGMLKAFGKRLRYFGKGREIFVVEG